MKITQILCALSFISISTAAFSGWKSGAPIVDDSYFAPQLSEHDDWEEISLQREGKLKKLERLEKLEAKTIKAKQEMAKKYNQIGEKHNWRRDINFIPKDISNSPKESTDKYKLNYTIIYRYNEIKQEIAQAEEKLKDLKRQYMQLLPEEDQENFLTGAHLHIPGMLIETGTSEERKNNDDLRKKYETLEEYEKEELLIRKPLEELQEKKEDFKEFFVQIPKQYKQLNDKIKTIQRMKAKLESPNT